jgi:hypothetical protein
MATKNETLPYTFSEEFDQKVQAAWAQAREETLAAGVAIFYRDSKTGIEVMEQPDGRFFEIRYNPGAPRERIYDVIRELPPGTIEKCHSSK